MRDFRPIQLALFLASLIYAMPCTAESKYLRDSIPDQWDKVAMLVQTTNSEQMSYDGDLQWWHNFNDSLLDSLITMGIERNYNVAIALKRSEMARSQMRQAQSGYYPTVSLSAGWQGEQVSGKNVAPYGSATHTGFYTAGLSAQWEIDLFGRIHAKVKNKKAAYNATRAEYAGTMVSMSAQIASTYVQLRMYQAQKALANAHSANQATIVNIARARFETSLASKLDVAQALETYYSTTAQIPLLDSSIHAAINSLAVLTNTPFEQMNDLLSQVRPMPEYRLPVNIGVPAELLRRRPDIVEAEMQIEECAAALGISKKEYLPTLTLSGTIGTSAHNPGDLMTEQSVRYLVTPTLSWNLFDGFNRRYVMIEARQNMEAAIDSYNLAVLNALSETDNYVTDYGYTLRYVEALDRVIEQSNDELRLSVDRYKTSLSPMSDVVRAQLNTLTAENNLITAKGRALSSLISLYEALGGGYDADRSTQLYDLK